MQARQLSHFDEGARDGVQVHFVHLTPSGGWRVYMNNYFRQASCSLKGLIAAAVRRAPAQVRPLLPDLHSHFRIEGVVAAVGPRLVTLDVGRFGGVREGQCFGIWRGERLIGRVKIVRFARRQATGLIVVDHVVPGRSVAVGDLARAQR